MNSPANNEAFERIKPAREALTNCNLCPRQCGVDRTAGEKGYCGLDDSVRCFRELVYYGEESELIPSHQIHFTGCNLRCEFCVVSEWNEEPSAAQKMDFDDTAKKISERQIQGAKTLNLLGGEPAVNLHGVLELLSRINTEIKVVWNSNMYYNDIVDKLIAGLIDVYLADFKCGNNNCAKILLGAHSYTEVVKRNILNAVKNADVIIRHVVIPGHSECCLKPIFEWLATEIPDVKLSLRGNYVPPASAISAPKEYLKPDDLQYATELARNMDLKLVR